MPFYLRKQNLLLFFACLLIFSLSLFFTPTYLHPNNVGVDDASIFFVYANNFLGGLGLVWNPGEAPVEGFTSFFWQIVCISLFSFSKTPENLILLFSLLILSLSSCYFLNGLYEVVEKTSEKLGCGVRISIVLIFFLYCLSSPGFITWNIVSLMDVSIWTSCLLLIVASYLLSHKRLFLIFISLAPLVRPEGLAILFIAYFIYCLDEVKTSNLKKIYQKLFKSYIAVVSPFFFLTLFRIIYFGFPFPNTYYAKVGSNKLEQVADGLKYFLSFLSEAPLLTIALIASLYCLSLSLYQLFTKANGKISPTTLPSALFLFGMFIYIYLGGDHFPLHRQYQAFWPLGIVPLLSLANRVLKINLLACFVFVSAFNSVFLMQVNKDMNFEYALSRWGREAGKKLNHVFAQSKLESLPGVSAIAIGGIAYAYQGELIDLMGITNVKMAHASSVRKGKKNHAAFDINTFYQIDPDFVVHFGPSCILRKGFQNDKFILEALKGLPRVADFRQRYQLFRLPSPVSSELPGGVCGFIKKSITKNFFETDLKIYDWPTA